MEYTRSGEYKLPGSIHCLGGNVALRLARFVPSTFRSEFVSSRSYYQVFNGSDVGDGQGLSIRKWEALQMPADLKGKSVLDIGCSEGFFCRECAKRGAQFVLGMDSSLGRLLYGRFTALREGLKIRYKMGVFPGSLPARKFDYVLCLSVLHHSLVKKDIWKVLTLPKHADDLAVLREQLRLLRYLITDGGSCILEIPYEYDDPHAERQCVNFELFNNELTGAGFTSAKYLGTWDYNAKHRAYKDRILYVAGA